MRDREISIRECLQRLGSLARDVETHLELYRAKRSGVDELVLSHRILRYEFIPSRVVIWIIIGKREHYLVLPRCYCSCDDFYFNTVTRGIQPCCYHMIAQIAGEEEGHFTSITRSDDDFDEYLSELVHVKDGS